MKTAEEIGIAELDGDVPRQRDDKEERDDGEPEGAGDELPIALSDGEENDDDGGQRGGDWTFRQRAERET